MPRYTVIAAVVALAGTMTAYAQQKPDFSGEWPLNRQASTLSPIVASVAQTGTLRIEHKEPEFKCQMTIVLDGKPFETEYEMLSDGRETVATAQGRRTVSSLRWGKDALVATSRVEIPNGEMTVSFRYELQDGGRRLRASEQLRAGGRDQDNAWVFEREPVSTQIHGGVARRQRSRTFTCLDRREVCRFCPVRKLPVFSSRSSALPLRQQSFSLDNHHRVVF